MTEIEKLQSQITPFFLKGLTAEIMCELGSGLLSERCVNDIVSAAYIAYYKDEYDSNRIIKDACIEVASQLLGRPLTDNETLMIKKRSACVDLLPLKIYKGMIRNKEIDVTAEIKILNDESSCKGIAVYDKQRRDVFISENRFSRHHIALIPNFDIEQFIFEYEKVFRLRVPNISEYINEYLKISGITDITSQVLYSVEQEIQRIFWIDSNSDDMNIIRDNIGKLWLRNL